MAKSPILGGFSTARSPAPSDNAAINLLVEVIETKDGKVPGFLYLASGLDLIGTLGNGPVRGVLPLNDILYVVSGSQVWSLTPNGIATLCGSIGDEKTPVSMFQNGQQLMLVDGVGGWLVPGGYPLVGGDISDRGGLYALNDTITLKAATGFQSSYPILKVTAVANNPVADIGVVNAGSLYVTATGVGTTSIQPQPGGGTGLTLNVAGTGSGITSAVVVSGGVGWSAGDTGTISAGSFDAAFRVTGVTAGAVNTIILLNRGTTYVTQLGVAAVAGPGIPSNLGAGLILSIAAAGAITAIGIQNPGRDFVVGNVGFINGGLGDATYRVTAVDGLGAVIGYSIIQGGTIIDPALTFSQKSTSGSGSGFTLTGPDYGAFLGLVPVTLPFDRPVVGDISDGFGVLVFLGQQILAASDQLDLSTWQPLSYGVTNQSPDNCISVHVIHDEVFVLKQANVEVWVDQGLANFPFAPVTSVHMEVGCMAPFSVAVADEELIWLGRNDQGQGQVMMATGYRVQSISTQALVNEFSKYPNLGDAIAYARQEGGHVCYVITFPEANKTWCYDKTSSGLVGYPIWTQLAAFDNGEFDRHWGNAFTPWRGSVEITRIPDAFQPEAVTMSSTTELTNDDLVGLPPSLATLMFSIWLDIPDGSPAGIIYTNQDDITLGSTNPGLFIKIQNDTQGSPQITVMAWDANNAEILRATYNFTTWVEWVNVLISIDTEANQVVVFANTTIGDIPTPAHLVGSVSWSSNYPIGNPSGHDWRVVAVS